MLDFLKASSLLASLLVAGTVWATPPAAFVRQGYVTIEGSKTKAKEPAGPYKSQFTAMQIYELRPPSTELTSGSQAPPHSPICFTRAPSASTMLPSLVTSGETLTVTFSLVLVKPDGKEALYRTLKLSDAKAISVKRTLGAKGAAETEEACFMYDRLDLKEEAPSK